MLKRVVKGIGLLELMLSLAIIAVLLIMATRYYSAASGSAKVQSAVDMVNAVRSAMQNLGAGSAGSTSSLPTIGGLVYAGYLPKSFIAASAGSTATSALTPWGTSSMTLSKGTKTGTFNITMDTPNSSVCNAVAQKVNATAALSNVASCSSGTLTVTYAYQ